MKYNKFINVNIEDTNENSEILNIRKMLRNWREAKNMKLKHLNELEEFIINCSSIAFNKGMSSKE